MDEIHYLERIENTVRNHWEAKALSDYGEATEYTYGEMAVEIERVAEWMTRMGIRPGDKVAICGRSCSRWGIAFLAIAKMRGVVVSILNGFKPETIKFLVSHSEAKLLFVGDVVINKIAGIDMGNVIVARMDEWRVVSPAGADILISDPKPATRAEWADRLDWPKRNLDELVLINYTSGTTDRPKGVMITNRNLSSNVTFGQSRIPNGPGDAVVSMLPLAHIFGVMYDFLYQLAGGVHISFMGRTPTPTLLLKAFHDVKPYMVLTVPLVIEKIVRGKILPAISKPAMQVMWYSPVLGKIARNKVRDKLLEAFGGSLRFLIVGGAAMNPKVERCLKQMHFPYTVGYGMTECAPLITYTEWTHYKRNTVGQVVDRMDIKIDSSNPQLKPGEVLVQGDNVFEGYYKDDQATRAAFDREGWFHTGDMGVIDRDGFLTLKGRSKNMILGPNGQNIYPEEIEAVLANMDRVLETVVVEREGKIIAMVYPDYEGIEKEQLRGLMAQNLAEANKILPTYSQIAKIELREEEFEKTPKNSIKRFMYK